MNLSIDFQTLQNKQIRLCSLIQTFPTLIPQPLDKTKEENDSYFSSLNQLIDKENTCIEQKKNKYEKQQQNQDKQSQEYNSFKQKLTEDIQENIQIINKKYQNQKNISFNPIASKNVCSNRISFQALEKNNLSKKQKKEYKIQLKKQQNKYNIENNQNYSYQENDANKILQIQKKEKSKFLNHLESQQHKQNYQYLKKIINHKSITVKNMPPYSETLEKDILKLNLKESPSTDFNQLQNHRKLINRVYNNVAYVSIDNQFSSSNQNSTSSLQQYTHKSLQRHEISYYSQVNQDLDQQNILLQLCDYFKSMISIFQLSKSMYYRSSRLFRKIYYLINNKQTTTYEFAAASITIYGKLQCQKLFNDYSKEFPNTNGLNQNLKEQIEKTYPSISFKRIRVAQSAILKAINFNLELQDNTIDLINQICLKWTQYTNQNMKNYPKLHMQVGSQTKDQRINLLNVIYLVDILDFFPDITFYPIQMDKNSLENFKIRNILLAIYINVYCSIFGQYRHHKSDKIECILSKFIKKSLRKQEKQINQLKEMIDRSKQYNMNQHLKVISLQLIQKVQRKSSKKESEDISQILHHQSLMIKKFDQKFSNWFSHYKRN